MAVKVDKTERAFREAMSVRFNEHDTSALIDALGLEFREEGDGLPEGKLTVLPLCYGAAVKTFSGASWIDLSEVTEDNPLIGVELARLRLLVDAANRLPALEGVARELGKDLGAWKDAFGPRSNTASIEETKALLARLRELLPGEGD